MITREIATNYDDVTLDSRLPARALQVFMCGALTGLSVGLLRHRLVGGGQAQGACGGVRRSDARATGRRSLTCHIS